MRKKWVRACVCECACVRVKYESGTARNESVEAHSMHVNCRNKCCRLTATTSFASSQAITVCVHVAVHLW